MEKLSYVLTQYLVSAHFHLAGRQRFSFSHRRFEFPCFCSNEFSITRSSFFSVIHVSVHIKNNAEKGHDFFLSTSPFGHVISLQIKPWVAFGFPYLLIEVFYIGIPVVGTDGRTVTWLPNFLGWVDYHISLAIGLRPRARFARGWSSANMIDMDHYTLLGNCPPTPSLRQHFALWVLMLA